MKYNSTLSALAKIPTPISERNPEQFGKDRLFHRKQRTIDKPSTLGTFNFFIEVLWLSLLTTGWKTDSIGSCFDISLGCRPFVNQYSFLVTVESYSEIYERFAWVVD